MANYLPLVLQIVPIFGSIYFAVLVLAFLWLKRDKKLAINFVIAFILTNAIVYGLKFLFQIPRPSQTLPAPFYDTSFPSGHAGRAFLYMTFLSQKFDRAFMIVSYILAALVAISRVQSGEHTVIDVLVGSAIGFGVSLVFVQYSDKIYKMISRIFP